MVIAWANSPGAYFSMLMDNAARDPSTLAGGKPAIRPERGRRCRLDDPDIAQSGLCADCQRELDRQGRPGQGNRRHDRRHALDRSRQRRPPGKRNAAGAVWTGEKDPVARHTVLNLPQAGNILKTFREKAERTEKVDPNARMRKDLPNLAESWRSRQEEINTAMTTLEMPLRLASCALARMENYLGALIVIPDPNLDPGQPPPDGHSGYPHLLGAGVSPMNDSTADPRQRQRIADSMIHHAMMELSQPIRVWLPHMGSAIESLYLCPADYMDAKRLPNKVRRELEAACGRRLHS